MKALDWPFADIPLVHHKTVDSTNQEAFRLAEAGTVPPELWVLAEHQTRGRGRQGRIWQSLPGNLYASLYIRLAITGGRLPQIGLVAGIAVHEAVGQVLASSIGQTDLCLKWPNDLLLAGGKVAGILVESRRADGARDDFFDVVIGIGVNISAAPLLDVGLRAEALATHAPEISRDAVFLALVRATRHWLDVWQDESGFASVQKAWLARACHIGRIVEIEQGEHRIKGRFETINDSGALVLVSEGGTRHTIVSGHLVFPDGPAETG